jgi:Ni,Fe-hydrogenase III component G
MNITIEAKTAASLGSAKRCLIRWADQMSAPEAHRLDVILPAGDLLAAAQALADVRWGMLSAITASDLGIEADAFELLYHFCEKAAVVTLRINIPREAAAVDSVCALYPSASFFERELMEMLGVDVIGTPNRDRLFLPDDWPEGVYPLRKDFQIEEVDA